MTVVIILLNMVAIFAEHQIKIIMKKLATIILISVLCSTVSFAQDEGSGDNGISFGAKAGVNFASLTGDDADELNLEGRTSFQIGGVVNIPVSEVFAVQPEVLYSGQGFTLEETIAIDDFEETVDGTGKLDYINVPILADFTVAEGFSLQVGPQVGFVITDEFEADGETESLDAESVDFSAVFGAQYRTSVGVFFQARYALGLTNVATEDDFEAKNGVFSLVAGWFFN